MPNRNAVKVHLIKGDMEHFNWMVHVANAAP